VFLQYDKQADGSYLPLARSNVDLGMGLERLLPIMQGVASAYETELFLPIVEAIRELSTREDPFATRVIADHLRAAMFILAEGVTPGNADQPYIARRLIRRAVRYGRELGIGRSFLARLAETAIGTLAEAYPELEQRRQHIYAALDDEESRFGRTLARGEVEFNKAIGAALADGRQALSGPAAFRLYETYGFPLELTQELAGQRGVAVDEQGFQVAFAEHQAQSRQGSAARFRGGLAERMPETTRLHTATHLLQAALRAVLGAHVEQRGSNITAERLRFDFSHPTQLTAEQLAEVEALVNTQIARDLPVGWAEMSVAEAREAGAIGLFGERYGERVKVYTIGDWSKEICGGPHVEQTGGLGHFRIVKEEAVGAGARRIRAVLEQ
jgi:alanyl-tRNA synthetase